MSEWIAYDKLDPVGEIRGDIRNAQLSSLIVNLFKARFGKKSAKTTKPIDFMPEWDKEENEQNEQQKSYQTVDEMKQQIQSIGKAFGANKKKDKNHKRPHELKTEKNKRKKTKEATDESRKNDSRFGDKNRRF